MPKLIIFLGNKAISCDTIVPIALAINNINNKNTTREIFDIVRKKLNIDMKDDEMLKMFSPVYEKFQLYNLILLKS